MLEAKMMGRATGGRGLLYSRHYYSGESSAQISPTSSSCLVQLMPFIIIIWADWAPKLKNKNEHSINAKLLIHVCSALIYRGASRLGLERTENFQFDSIRINQFRLIFDSIFFRLIIWQFSIRLDLLISNFDSTRFFLLKLSLYLILTCKKYL